MLLVFLWAECADDAAVSDGLSFWHRGKRYEFDGVRPLNVAYSLREAAEFICKAVHPDIAVFIHFDQVNECYGFSCRFIYDRTRVQLFWEILL